MEINLKNNRKPIIGVMGPGDECPPEVSTAAFEIGKLIAENGWVTLSGGRNSGVMDAVCKGAKSRNGVTIGILPGNDTSEASKYLDYPIVTGMGSARNNINVLTADIIVACGIGAGTASEISLALKAGKPVILVNSDVTAIHFFKNMGQQSVYAATDPEEVIEMIKIIADSADK